MDWWMGELYTFPGWATSSLKDPFAFSYLFSSFCKSILPFARPVQCALQRPASIPQSSTRVALLWRKNDLSCNCYNAFSNLQLQSRLPGASQHHSCFAARVLSQPVGFPHSRSVALNRPASARHQQCGHFWAALIPSVFNEFYVKPSPR